MSLTGTGRAPGTAGEIAHGTTASGAEFHVTAPINLYSFVSVAVDLPTSDDLSGFGDTPAWQFSGSGSGSDLIRNAVLLTAKHLIANIDALGPLRIDITHITQLPPLRGMGEEVAGVLAAARATANAFGLDLTAGDERHILRSVGVTGGVAAHPEVVEHSTLPSDLAGLTAAYPWSPRMDIVLTIPARIQFTSRSDIGGTTEEHAELLEAIRAGSSIGDEFAFADAASLSAWRNQTVNANPLYGQLVRYASEHGADGIIVSHAGSVAGLIYLHATADALQSAAAALAEELPGDVSVQIVTIAGTDK